MSKEVIFFSSNSQVPKSPKGRMTFPQLHSTFSYCPLQLSKIKYEDKEYTQKEAQPKHQRLPQVDYYHPFPKP
jgi:hypothetical protein